MQTTLGLVLFLCVDIGVCLKCYVCNNFKYTFQVCMNKIVKLVCNSWDFLGQVSRLWIVGRTRRRCLSPFSLEWWHCDQSIACYQTSLHNESSAQLQKKDCQRLLWRKRWGARCWIERCILVWLNQILVAILLDQILESQVVLHTVTMFENY